MIVKEKLSDIKEKFEQAQRLIEETKSDSLEPYKSHYKARDILEGKLRDSFVECIY